MRKIPQPGLWGTIGYTGTGGHVGVTQRPTRAGAEEDAKAECESKTARRCQTLTVAENRCVALVHSIFNDGRGPVVQNYSAFGDDPTSVRQGALADCKAKAQIRENCEIRRTLCADGRN